MSQQPTVTDFQIVFGSVPRPFPADMWKNRATMFLVDDTNPADITFYGKSLSETLNESFIRPKELRTYRVAGLQLGPILYDIPAVPGVFVSIRPNADNLALSVCELFVDCTEDTVKPQFSNPHPITRKLGSMGFSRICLMAVSISGKMEMEMTKTKEVKFNAAYETIFGYLKVSPMKTPLWALIATMALVVDAKNNTLKKDEVLQAVKFVCDAYATYVETVEIPPPTESSPVQTVVLGGTRHGGFQLDASPVPEGALLC